MIATLDTPNRSLENKQENLARTNASFASQSLPEHTKISGRFDQFRSPYWGLAIASVGTRYLARPLSRPLWTSPKHVAKYAYSGVAGAIMMGVVAYYARRTWKDMKKVFAETLAWEFDKQPQDVTFRDFINSKNTVVHETLVNYAKYNARRVGVNSVFFAPFIVPGLFKDKPGMDPKLSEHHPESPLDLGVGGNSMYLAYDIINRKITSFEELQGFIDRKINHTDDTGETIASSDLMNIYRRHQHYVATKIPFPSKDSQDWANNERIFNRVADLMNQTYHNTPNTQQANFTVPMLISLMGEGHIQSGETEKSLTYIEIANRYGIKAVKQIEKAERQGMDFETASWQFPIVQMPMTENRPVNHVERLNARSQKEAAQPEMRIG